MDLLTVDTISAAKDKILRYQEELRPRITEAGLCDAAGKVIAADVSSRENIPPYRRSTVDGYAVRCGDVGAAGDMVPTMLRITGEVVLGEDPRGITLDPGCCVYVPTGGYVPDEAGAVVMVEYCEIFGDDMLAVSRSASEGENIAGIGEDISEGSVILRAGRKLRSRDIGVLAAAGITSVPVYEPWRVSVISTGDELVQPCEKPGPGQIRDVNSYAIAARCASEGFEVVRMAALRDDRESILRTLREAKEDSDIVVMSGGSSKGLKDMTADIIGEAADRGVLTHGIAAKPGKPTVTGYDAGTNTLFIGLPGHPAAALMVFEQLVIKLWHCMTGQHEDRAVLARVTANVPSAPGRRTFQLVKLTGGDDPEAEPVIAKSGMIYPMSVSDGYFEMEENQEGVRAGDTVRVHLWK